MIHRCAPPRQDARIHLFIEGQDATLCGRDIDGYHVLSDEALPTCAKCVEKLPRGIDSLEVSA